MGKQEPSAQCSYLDSRSGISHTRKCDLSEYLGNFLSSRSHWYTRGYKGPRTTR